MHSIKKNAILIGIALLIMVIPLWMYAGNEWMGSDDAAKDLIQNINPNYQPWMNSIWEPSSDKMENLLFHLQRAIGIVFIGVYIGYRMRKHRKERMING